MWTCDPKVDFRNQSDLLCCVLIARLCFGFFSECLVHSPTVHKAKSLRWLCCSKMAAMSRAGRMFLALLCNKSAGYSRVPPLSHQLTVWMAGLLSRFIAMTFDHCTAHAGRTPPPPPLGLSQKCPQWPIRLSHFYISLLRPCIRQSWILFFLSFFLSHGD